MQGVILEMKMMTEATDMESKLYWWKCVKCHNITEFDMIKCKVCGGLLLAQTNMKTKGV